MQWSFLFPNMRQLETSMRVDVMGRVPGQHIKESKREKRGKVYEGRGQARPKGPRELARFPADPKNQGKIFPVPIKKLYPLPSQTESRSLQNLGPLFLQWHCHFMPPMARRGRHKNCGPSTRCPRGGCTTCFGRTVDLSSFILIGKYPLFYHNIHRLHLGRLWEWQELPFPTSMPL
ncbi:hypothetical protein GWK47_008596 [Chionoecetes opilio]|uniref:Uncharacterized protein n=1 Tax=Chionoecetes opilio TaxID=41210 RepID=A0A8J4Y3M4_CHIOP|nr:hypothetical protein GWK47_008596 [Chionoecetes opilio]